MLQEAAAILLKTHFKPEDTMPRGECKECRRLQAELGAALGRVEDLQQRLADLHRELERLRWRQGKCREERRERAWERGLTLLRFLVRQADAGNRLPTTGHGAWVKIHAAFTVAYPALCLTTDPPGPLDVMPAAWVREHTVSVHALRVGYHRWLRNAH